jgi:hypothetical protein
VLLLLLLLRPGDCAAQEQDGLAGLAYSLRQQFSYCRVCATALLLLLLLPQGNCAGQDQEALAALANSLLLNLLLPSVLLLCRCCHHPQR